MDRVRDRKGAKEQTEGGKLAEDEDPDHRIAGEFFENSPASLLLFAIGRRHLLSVSARRRTVIPLSWGRVCRRTNRDQSIDDLLFAPSRHPLRLPTIKQSEFQGPADETMSEAQLGLLTATPIIILFAAALRKMGVLSTTATVSAVGLSVAIAVVLFVTQ